MSDRGLHGVTNADARSSIATVAHYLLSRHTASLGINRIPAATAGQPLALLLPAIMSHMGSACTRVLPPIAQFDIVVCGLPGHGISREANDVSPLAKAREYSALIDRYVPAPQRLCMIGETFGGLIGAALAVLRPDRVDHLVLLDTPLCLTRPPLAALLSMLWRDAPSPYDRRIFLEVFNFDPQDGSGRGTADHHTVLAGLHANCTVFAGCEEFAIGDAPVAGRPPSQLTNADLALLQAYGHAAVLPRIASAGHCLLLDNPTACVAARARHLAS
jgi:pimeloyl-ACP methyl ester carboxylesterase